MYRYYPSSCKYSIMLVKYCRIYLYCIIRKKRSGISSSKERVSGAVVSDLNSPIRTANAVPASHLLGSSPRVHCKRLFTAGLPLTLRCSYINLPAVVWAGRYPHARLGCFLRLILHLFPFCMARRGFHTSSVLMGGCSRVSVAPATRVNSWGALLSDTPPNNRLT
jgi:hypothetical protein